MCWELCLNLSTQGIAQPEEIAPLYDVNSIHRMTHKPHGAIECCAVLCQHVTIMHCTMHDPSSILLWITLSGQCTLHTWYQNSKCSKIQGVANDNFFFYFGIPGVKTGPPEDWNIQSTSVNSKPLGGVKNVELCDIRITYKPNEQLLISKCAQTWGRVSHPWSHLSAAGSNLWST